MPPGASTPRGPDEPSNAEDPRLETARLDALSSQPIGPEIEYRRIARRLLHSGQPDKALAELIRFSREQPMSARMASALATLALATKKTGPIFTVVTQGADEAEGRERLGVLRALARLQRRTEQEPAAIETLTTLLAEAAEDRRARLVLNALLERFERWDELDASLDKETRLLLRRRYFRAASRVTLRRARLWGERLREHARAALRYGQAAQYAEQGQDPHSAFLLRMLWLRALVHAEAPSRSIDEGVNVVLDAAERVGKEARARVFIRELGLKVPSARLPQPPAAAAPAPSVTQPLLPVVGPSSTQADVEAAEAEPAPRGQAGEALLVAAASAPAASMTALHRLESRYVARGAWRELARFYRETADGRPDPSERVGWLEKLAEVLESELDDAIGASKVWEEVALLTGDAQAVSEQVRILDERQDSAGVKQALDSGVGRASDPAEKARLLVLRGADALARADLTSARADLEEALRVAPGTLEAAATLAEIGQRTGDVGPLRVFEKLLLAAPKNVESRSVLVRRLARVADAFKDPRLASTAWSEVLLSSPQDEEALSRLWVLAKGQRDEVTLERVLRQVLSKDPRGEFARAAWMDLVTALERSGRFDDALTCLKDAVKAEPGHLEAWLCLVDRLQAMGADDEAAWALEHAATSAPEGPRRVSLWRRLARHARERMDDEERAEKYEERIERARAEPLPAPAPSPGAPLPGGPLMVPAPRASRPKPPVVVIEPSVTVTDEEESEAFASALGADREDERTRPSAAPVLPERLQRIIAPLYEEVARASHTATPPSQAVDDETREAPADDFVDDDVVDEVRSEEATAGQRLSGGRAGPHEDATPAPAPAAPTAAPRRAPRPNTQELPVEPEPVSLEAPISKVLGSAPSKQLSEERKGLFERVRANPLDPDGYRMLAEHFDTANDANRSSLMLELARALEGDPSAAPRTPKLILSATDRAGLRHPFVRSEGGELVTLASAALCRLFPAKGKDARGAEEFSLESGKGAKVAADALLAAVRLLGMRAPEVYVSDEPGPPFSALQTNPPRLVVNRAALKKPVADAELRFYSGRGLFTLSAELLALRTLKRDQLKAGLDAVGQMLKGQTSTEARLLREAIPARAMERLKVLWPTASRTVDLAVLMEGARHSVNRAGLVVCGGIAPAIASLRAKKALPVEVTELIRFAASERYLQLRNRRLGKK
jgi:tetratricopeptide (TPR) repeat protein